MAEERTEKSKEDDVSASIFCKVGLDRTPLLTRVRVLPWQKDTLGAVYKEQGETEWEQKKKD